MAVGPAIRALVFSSHRPSSTAYVLTAHGQSALDLLLDPLPSLAQSGTSFAQWLAFKRCLLADLVGEIHTALAT